MFCPNCGNKIGEGALFCASCGTRVEAPAAPQQPAYEAVQQPAYEAVQQPVYEAPVQPAYEAPVQPAYEAVQQPAYQIPQQPVQVAPAVNNANDPELNSLATNTMIFGILSAALGLCIGVPGIIFSVLTKNKVNEFVSRAGSLYGKAKVGSILAKVGLPVSIVCTAIYTISFFVGLLSGL